MNKQQANDMIYSFFWECSKENLCTIPINDADKIIDAWFDDYWSQYNTSKCCKSKMVFQRDMLRLEDSYYICEKCNQKCTIK